MTEQQQIPPCADEVFPDEQVKPEANRQRKGRFFARRPRLLTNGGCGSTRQRPGARDDVLSVDVLLKVLDSRKKNQIQISNSCNSLSKEKSPLRARFERWQNEEAGVCTNKPSHANVTADDVPPHRPNKSLMAKNISKIPTIPRIIEHEKRGRPMQSAAELFSSIESVLTCSPSPLQNFDIQRSGSSTNFGGFEEMRANTPCKRRSFAEIMRHGRMASDACTYKSGSTDVAADGVPSYKSSKALIAEKISKMSTIPIIEPEKYAETIPTIKPDRQGRFKQSGRTRSLNADYWSALDDQRPKIERSGRTGTSTRSLNPDCFTTERYGSTLDDQRQRIQRRGSSKTVLSALGVVCDLERPIFDVPEGLDSGELTAEDLFPAPRIIRNPYEEDKEFIEGLVFFAPSSEDAIRSMLGHPARRFMPGYGHW